MSGHLAQPSWLVVLCTVNIDLITVPASRLWPQGSGVGIFDSLKAEDIA